MKTHNVQQGSKEWHELRASHFNASEAPAMMGASKYQSRDELLLLKKTGVEPEISAEKQALFNRGHAAEAAIRPHIAKIVGEELYPVTGSESYNGINWPLGASYDGLTMLEDVVFEHKLLSQPLKEAVEAGELEPHYYWQLEQQLLLSGASRAIFVTSDGTPENMAFMWYEPVPGRAEELLNGWRQFEKDLETFEPPQQVEPVVGKTIEALPALVVNITDLPAIATNIDEFQEKALALIGSINTDLQSDQDFADAENMVKFCKEAEAQIKAVKQVAVDQMADVSKVFKAMDYIAEEMRQKRLQLDKLVKQQKEARKSAIINQAIADFNEFVAGVNASLGGSYIVNHPHNFSTVTKGLKSLASIQSKVNDELARLKIEVNALADTIRTNLKTLDDAGDYRFLFNDLSLVIQKEPEDFAALVSLRVSNYKEKQCESKEQQTQTAVIDPDPISQPEIEAPQTQQFSDEERVMMWLDNLHASINGAPTVLDSRLSKFIAVRRKRMVAIMDEIESKVSSQAA